jgi:mediator of RNA polymerase II transcription subunit 12
MPDAFVNPRMWIAHSALVSKVLSENITAHSADQHIEQSSRDIQQALEDNLADIKRRNESMLFHNLPPRILAFLASAVSDIQVITCIFTIYIIPNYLQATELDL